MAEGPVPALSQYRVFSNQAINLRIELISADGSSAPPVDIAALANTPAALADLIETEGSQETFFGEAVGAYVTNTGAATVFANTGMRRNGTVVAEPGATSAIQWEPGATYALGMVA